MIEIKFPKEFDKYINDKKVESEIVINYDLPYYLRIPDECMEFELEEGFFKYISRARKILIKTERKFNQDQSIAIRHSTFSFGTNSYGFESTSVVVFIEIFKDEIDNINQIFKNEDFLVDLMKNH